MIQAAPVDVSAVLKGNLASVRESALRASRGRYVTIVCVTKYVGADVAIELVKAGATDAGENRVIEGAAKFSEIKAAGLDFVRHLIGPVQSNKAARIPGAYDWCQSLTRKKVADVLERAASGAGVTLNCTIEVNIGGEPQKEGLSPGETSEFAGYLAENCPSLILRGLMCIPPIADERGTRAYFSRMRELFENVRTEFSSRLDRFDTLSMGMSADYEAAIEEGATMVRVGSLLYCGLPGFMD